MVVAATGQLENRRAPTTTLEGWRSFVHADPSELALLSAERPRLHAGAVRLSPSVSADGMRASLT